MKYSGESEITVGQICLYIDEDASRKSLITSLRNSRIDLITTLEANNRSLSDSEQLIWATKNNRTIYTFNVRDYCRLHNLYMIEGKEHAGIVVAQRQNYFVGEQLRGLQKLIATKSAEDIKSQLIFLGMYLN